MKGQIVGPGTAGLYLRDARGLPIACEAELRRSVTDWLIQCALWQAKCAGDLGMNLLLVVDEPHPVWARQPRVRERGFESARIARRLVESELLRMIRMLQSHRVRVGLHSCAEADWKAWMRMKPDVLSFDAERSLDTLLRQGSPLLRYLSVGGRLMVGIVSTQPGADLSAEGNARRFLRVLRKYGAAGEGVWACRAQHFWSPSCGLGGLGYSGAIRVLRSLPLVVERVRSFEGGRNLSSVSAVY